MSTTTVSEFDDATAVMAHSGHTADRDNTGCYSTTVSERWLAFGGVANGGYLLALCLRALEQEMALRRDLTLGEGAPQPDPLAVSAHFVRPGSPGPATVTAEVTKQGRRASTGTARLSQADGPVVLTQATYTDLSTDPDPDPTTLGVEPPTLPDPSACTDPVPLLGLSDATVGARVDYRLHRVPGFWYGTPSRNPVAEFWLRFADGRDPDTIALAMLVDAAAPVVLDLGVGGSSTIELTVHVRARPAPGWLACRARTRHVSGGYHEEDFEIWDSAGVLVAQSRQLALVR